jgi:hypothetical protein
MGMETAFAIDSFSNSFLSFSETFSFFFQQFMKPLPPTENFIPGN